MTSAPSVVEYLMENHQGQEVVYLSHLPYYRLLRELRYPVTMPIVLATPAGLLEVRRLKHRASVALWSLRPKKNPRLG